ncbi:MAG: NERD domain-containing protein [Candidatus Obscuribacterales bacterium]|nr:NERD domain-containing protein [Candidatus Obscuribacterales bacterium]
MFKIRTHPQRLLAISRLRTIGLLFLSGFFCLAPALVWFGFRAFNWLVVIVCLILSRFSFLRYESSLIEFEKARSGVEAEDLIARVLKDLPRGWNVQANVPLSGCGDADFFLRSPTNRAFVLEVKGHAGKITFDGTELVRRQGRRTKAFEKNFVLQVTEQSVVLQNRFCMSVTPVLVFTRAKLPRTKNRIGNVVLLEKSQLIDFLRESESDSSV